TPTCRPTATAPAANSSACSAPTAAAPSKAPPPCSDHRHPMQDAHLKAPAFTSLIVPVIVLGDARQAVPLAHALLEGGIDVMEITLRSDVALDAIEAVAREVPQMHLGAGTVTRASDVPRIIDAGARFALSPGCTDALVDAVRATGLPFIPGVMTPSEVMR